MHNMIIEIPELEEISKKLDRVVLLLEKLTGDTGQRLTPPTSVQEETPTKRLMTVKEVAGYLNISVATVYAMVSARRIPFLKIGSRVLFDLIQIKRWITKNSHNEMSRSR